jgi:quinol monooxygenase YgiN
MAYVVAATYRAEENEAEKIREILEIMAPLSRAEPACLYYQAHRSPEDPRVFFLYEQYTDEAGYQAHMETEHFAQYIRGEAIPRLESRERAFYVTLDGDT